MYELLNENVGQQSRSSIKLIATQQAKVEHTYSIYRNFKIYSYCLLLFLTRATLFDILNN